MAVRTKVKKIGRRGETPRPESVLTDRLARVCLFSGLSAADVTDIVAKIASGGVRRFKRGEVIVYEGTPAKELVAVLSGVVSVYESGVNGERHLVRTVEAGQLFGATLVTMRTDYYPGLTVAATDCETVFFDIGKIRDLWRADEDSAVTRGFFVNLHLTVCEYVHFCWRKMSIMACPKTEDRFLLYLTWYASEVGANDVTLPFVRMEDCARYLGVARTSLSPAIARLVRRGEIANPGKARFVLLKKA